MARSGFGITEALIGAGLVSAAFLAAPSILRSLDKGTRKTRTLGTMIAVESAILTWLDDPTNLTAAQRTALTQRPKPQPFELWLAGELVARAPSAGAQAVHFDLNGRACNPGLLSPNCIVRVDFDLHQYDLTPTPPPGELPRYKLAYRVSSLEAAQTPIPPLGDPLFGADPANYELSIPLSYYDPNFNQDCLAQADGLFLRGYDTATNQIRCWKRPLPTDACRVNVAGQPDQLAVGVQVSGDRIVPKCVNVANLRCADDTHVLAGLNAHFLDPRVPFVPAQAGICRPLFKATTPPRTAPTGAKICPAPNFSLSGGQCVNSLTDKGAVR